MCFATFHLETLLSRPTGMEAMVDIASHKVLMDLKRFGMVNRCGTYTVAVKAPSIKGTLIK